MTFSRFSILAKSFRRNSFFLLATFLLLSSASCRPEKYTVEVIPQINNGKFRVETDYSYYYVVYRYGKMKAANTIYIRKQHVWEHNFTTEPGDTLMLEVHTITSNIPGTSVKANIMLNGKTVKAQETVNECIDGDCYQAKPLDLSIFAIIK